jgi:aspartate/methionine/tyrosine aminotransferase
MIARHLQPFGTTIFSEMTRLAQEHGAINLAQGFPDFDGPREIIDAAVDALHRGHNQYARSMGMPSLVQAIAAKRQRESGLIYDPMTEVLVFSGATEGIAATMLGFLNPGDEVILFEPFYDSYPAVAAMAGATVRSCPLRFPDFALDPDALAALFTEKTRLLVLNTPHNPTGKVFTKDELAVIAALCITHDVHVLADEVYEHLTYDDAKHLSIAALPGMRERTLTLSSSGKTFSLTGWKIGWGTGPAPLVQAAQAAHQFLTFATATPLQVAIGKALVELGDAFFATLRAEYDLRRRFLLEVLTDAGFTPAVPQGTYFILASYEKLSNQDDRAMARTLVEEHGVAAIPPSVFYSVAPEEGRRLLRFAFCKKTETLERAAERLRKLRR